MLENDPRRRRFGDCARPVFALLVYVAVSVRRVAGGPAAGGVCGAASPAVPGDNIDVICRGGDDDDGYDDDDAGDEYCKNTVKQ